MEDSNAPAAAVPPSEEATTTDTAVTAAVATTDATADTDMAVASPVTATVTATQNNGDATATATATASVPTNTNTTTPGKAIADPSNTTSTSFGSPTLGFGSSISPPGMRLRSGKKKPTPIKSNSKSTGKRRRRSGVGIGIGVGINYDSASDYESDTGSMASGIGGSSTAVVDGEVVDAKRQRVEISSPDKDVNMNTNTNTDDNRNNGDTNANVNGNMNGNSTSMMMETIPEQNEVEAAVTATATPNAKATSEAQRMASEDRSANITNNTNTNGSGSEIGITPVAAAAASEAARIATTPPSNNIISPPGIQLRLPSQHTPGPASASARARTSFVKPQAAVSVAASASVQVPAPAAVPTSRSAYQGTARLRDFTTPAKGGRFAPSPAFSNGASAAGTDSEVERLDLTMARDHATGEEEEGMGEHKDGREEGRRDGLVHAYFKDGNEVETKMEETSSRGSGSGGEGMSVIGLCCIALMLHFTLTWMSGSVFRPFFVFSNVPHCADHATASYGRLFGASEENIGLEMVVQVEDDGNDNDNAIEEEEAIQIPVEQEQEEVEDIVPEPVVEEEEPEPDPEPETIEVEEVVENIVWVDNLELEENERELLKQRRMIQEWNLYKVNTSRTKDLIESKTKNIMGGNIAISDEMSALERKDATKREELTAWQNALDPSLEIMDALDSASGKETFELKGKLNESFDKLEDWSKVLYDYEALNVLVTDHIRIPGENCLGENLNLKMIAEDVPIPVAKPSPRKKKKKKKKKQKKVKVSSGVSIADYVTAENVEEAKSDINEAIVALFADIRHGSESFRAIDDWMEEQIDMLKDNFSLGSGPNLDNIKIEEPDLTEYLEVAPAPAPAPTPTPPPSGIALKRVQAIIDGGVEVLKADITGEHDYASIRAGSKIIKSGPRQTSPSLADNLPLMNQLMGKLGLRFYGNGPHAALEPTYPQDSLGQCWSFEREGDRKRIMIKELQGDADLEDDPDRGEYATLGVKLAKPIFVKSVVIEHTKKTISPERGTAIRNFRVIGFQDENADGEPWLLGNFEYNSSSKKYLQEFEVNTKDENGLPIPKLKSIALAVDSNWGAEYCCLYRFRVNGSSQRVKN